MKAFECKKCKSIDETWYKKCPYCGYVSWGWIDTFVCVGLAVAALMIVLRRVFS